MTIIKCCKVKAVYRKIGSADKPERVDHPSWYNQGKIEVIDFIRDQKMSYVEGNVIKYVCRYKFKGKPLEDLKKAEFYLKQLIEDVENEPPRP